MRVLLSGISCSFLTACVCLTALLLSSKLYFVNGTLSSPSVVMLSLCHMSCNALHYYECGVLLMGTLQLTDLYIPPFCHKMCYHMTDKLSNLYKGTILVATPSLGSAGSEFGDCG